MNSKAHVVLELTRLSTHGDLVQLHQLIVQQTTLKLHLILRILLTYLPETLDPQDYYDILATLSKEHPRVPSDSASGEFTSSHDRLSDVDACERVRRLHLLPLIQPQHRENQLDIEKADAFTQFLLHRAYRVESETGSLPLVKKLVEPFLSHSVLLRTWAISTLLPLLRLDYEYYANAGSPHSLQSFERLSSYSAIQELLSNNTTSPNQDFKKEIGRDLRGIVGPWTYGKKTTKRRKLESATRRRSSAAHLKPTTEEITGSQELSPWVHVNDWLLDLSLHDYSQSVSAVLEWDGPSDIDYGGWNNPDVQEKEDDIPLATQRYAQTGLAMFYANHATSKELFEESSRLLERLNQLASSMRPPDQTIPNTAKKQGLPQEYIKSLSTTQVLRESLLQGWNPLTNPTEPSLFLAKLLLESADILCSFGDSKSVRDLLSLAVFGTRSEQLAELRQILHRLTANSHGEHAWLLNRDKILWLCHWADRADIQETENSTDTCGVFCKVPMSTLENEILKAMLAGTNYREALSVYCEQDIPVLPLGAVEKAVIDAALASYDSASNGNKTRGGVRKALEIVNAFNPIFPESESLHQINALIKATHAMSFYSLTLQHGVPFQPVNIRAHKDPMLLVGKILEQNPRSYTKLDDLLDIGWALVEAGLNVTADKSHSTGKGTQDLLAKRRITGMAIEAALREEDFDTAYSYIISRLPQTSKARPAEQSAEDDDISWQVAYKAGCHELPRTSGASKLRPLEQRMELLSQALLLAPSSALTEILEVWRQREEDLNAALAREAAAEEKWDKRGDQKIPGGFSPDPSPSPQRTREPSRAALNEEAPMGLFDVARGAAATLSKNAFPLRGSRNAGSLQSAHEKSLSKTSAGGSDSGSGTEIEGRVRKRDMVSNMVTGGLASGIGWVIGAPPQEK